MGYEHSCDRLYDLAEARPTKLKVEFGRSTSQEAEEKGSQKLRAKIFQTADGCE